MNGLMNGEIDIINNLTRHKIEPEDVYVFSLILADNEMGNNYERFSDESIRKLEQLFYGVSGTINFESNKKQKARIFSCRTETVLDKKTFDGRDFVRLTARAYTLKTDDSSELFMKFNDGITKEASIGCSVSKRVCSICGRENISCSHISGKEYDGKLCYMTLCEPADAYEWNLNITSTSKKINTNKLTKFLQMLKQVKLFLKGVKSWDL